MTTKKRRQFRVVERGERGRREREESGEGEQLSERKVEGAPGMKPPWKNAMMKRKARNMVRPAKSESQFADYQLEGREKNRQRTFQPELSTRHCEHG